jgi:glutathione peroxidase
MVARLLTAMAAALSLAGPVSAEESVTAHDFSFSSIEGRPLRLADFRGKALLVVNTASRCGFTQQYEGLQEVWERHRNRGLVVLGVPSNDFGGQEPGSEAEIKDFCEVTFGVDFPLTAKVRVTGDDAHPFYRWAAGHFGPMSRPRWNFHKYLVDRDGKLVDWFSTPTAPTAPRVVRAIEAALAKSPAAGD